MTRRRRWLVLNYGPGAILAGFGLAGFVATGALWSLAILFSGCTLLLGALSAVNLYRAAYFRGRGEQLRDIADGIWPDPTKMRPGPWDHP